MAGTDVFFKESSAAYTRLLKLLSAVTTTGPGAAVDLGVVMSQFTWQMRKGGTTPTNVVVAIEGSIDEVNWFAVETETITAFPSMFHLLNTPIRFIRANYVSKTGGDATTAVTVECVGGGN